MVTEKRMPYTILLLCVSNNIKNQRFKLNQIYYMYLLIAIGDCKTNFCYKILYLDYCCIQIKVLHITYKTNQIHCLGSFYLDYHYIRHRNE